MYEKLLSGKLDPRLKFLAHEGLGYALEKKGKLSEAQATFAKLGGDAASLGGFYKDRARYHEARLTELQGNPTEAARIITRCWTRIRPPRCGTKFRIASRCSS